jgi:hypothetical protein
MKTEEKFEVLDVVMDKRTEEMGFVTAISNDESVIFPISVKIGNNIVHYQSFRLIHVCKAKHRLDFDTYAIKKTDPS